MKGTVMQYTRRELGKLALSAIPATALFPSIAGSAERPNSKVNGVTIGMNVPYNFGMQAMSAEEILQRCVQLGVSGVELRARPVEAFMGLPANLQPQPGGGNRGGARPVEAFMGLPAHLQPQRGGGNRVGARPVESFMGLPANLQPQPGGGNR